ISLGIIRPALPGALSLYHFIGIYIRDLHKFCIYRMSQKLLKLDFCLKFRLKCCISVNFYCIFQNMVELYNWPFCFKVLQQKLFMQILKTFGTPCKWKAASKNAYFIANKKVFLLKYSETSGESFINYKWLYNLQLWVHMRTCAVS